MKFAPTMFAMEMLMQCMGVGVIIIITVFSSPSSEDESKGRSESGNDRTCGTGTCLCLNKNPEGELFFPQTTLLRDAILAKDNCGCEQDMTWKNQQMEMKNKGAPERDGKGK
jgi:hypothetical protein